MAQQHHPRLGEDARARAARMGINLMDDKAWPRCAQCGKPVDDLRSWATSAGVRFVVRCHGEEQAGVIRHTVLRSLDLAGDELVFGPAFHPGGEPLLRALRGMLQRQTYAAVRAPIVIAPPRHLDS